MDEDSLFIWKTILFVVIAYVLLGFIVVYSDPTALQVYSVHNTCGNNESSYISGYNLFHGENPEGMCDCVYQRRGFDNSTGWRYYNVHELRMCKKF